MIFDNHSRNDSIKLSDGRYARELRLNELRAVMNRLRIPGMTGTENKSQLLDLFQSHLIGVAATLRQPGHTFAVPLPEAVAAAALEIVEKQAGA